MSRTTLKPPYVNVARVRKIATDMVVELGMVIHFCEEAAQLGKKDWPAQVHQDLDDASSAAMRLDDLAGELFTGCLEPLVVISQKAARLAREKATAKKGGAS